MGLYDTEFIGLKKPCCVVIFECLFLLLSLERKKIDCHHWKVNDNIFEYDKSMWGTTLRHMNRLRFYDRVITAYNKGCKELRTVRGEMYNFSGLKHCT
jgi:hypothetical protein